MDRSGSQWFAEDVAFIGTVVSEDSTGNVQIEGHDEEDVLQTALTQKYEPWGFTSRLPDGTEVLILPKEDAEVAVLGVNVDRGTLDVGQAKMYDAGSNTILLQGTAGGIKAETAAAHFIDLISKCRLGADTAAEVLLKGTTVCTDHSAWLTAIKSAADACSTSINNQQPSWSCPDCIALSNIVKTFTDAVTTGCTTVLALISTNWKSTKHALDT